MPIILSTAKKIQQAHINAKFCRLCDLCLTRHTVVPGYGNIHSRLCFIGEAPGKLEDLEGLPFVGKSGLFLRKNVEKVTNFALEDFYVFNSVLCRPPNNRKPTRVELRSCRVHINTLLRLCDCSVFITLGLTATRLLLPHCKTLDEVLGVTHTLYDGRLVLPNYHPAYVLRNAQSQKTFRRIIRMGFKHAQNVG